MSDITLSEEWDENTVPTIIMPSVEEDIPLPKSATEAFPELSTADEVRMRASTIKLISDLTNQDIEVTPEHRIDAEKLATEMVQNPAFHPDFSNYPNETLAYLAGMVGRMNSMIVNDLADLKLYVVNKLVQEVELAKDSKARISALSKLGEIDGVDAFKKRTEVTVKQMSMDEVENELLATLQSLKGRVIDAEVVEIGRTVEVNREEHG